MIYARVIDGVVVAWATEVGYARTHSSVRKLWKKAPDDVREGWRVVNGVWTPPPSAHEPPT